MFAVLDSFGLFGAIYLCTRTEHADWKITYGLLATAFGLLGALDVAVLLEIADVNANPLAGTPMDLLWILPQTPLVLATRMAQYRPVSHGVKRSQLTDLQPSRPRGTFGPPLALYAATFSYPAT